MPSNVTFRADRPIGPDVFNDTVHLVPTSVQFHRYDSVTRPAANLVFSLGPWDPFTITMDLSPGHVPPSTTDTVSLRGVDGDQVRTLLDSGDQVKDNILNILAWLVRPFGNEGGGGGGFNVSSSHATSVDRMMSPTRRGMVMGMVALLCATSTLLGACSFRGCDSTKLSVTPIDRSSLAGPVTLEARLTSGGDPVRGAAVSFFILSDGPMTTSKGRLIGAVDTDADGFARLSFSRGLAALEPPYYVINGFSAEFRFTGSVPGREGDLCRAQGEFRFV